MFCWFVVDLTEVNPTTAAGEAQQRQDRITLERDHLLQLVTQAGLVSPRLTHQHSPLHTPIRSRSPTGMLSRPENLSGVWDASPTSSARSRRPLANLWDSSPTSSTRSRRTLEWILTCLRSDKPQRFVGTVADTNYGACGGLRTIVALRFINWVIHNGWLAWIGWALSGLMSRLTWWHLGAFQAYWIWVASTYFMGFAYWNTTLPTEGSHVT